MGLRSWLSPVRTKEEWKEAYKSIIENDLSYGIYYCLKIETEGTPFEKEDVVIAWSGDCSSSLDALKPVSSKARTWLLDNIIEQDKHWSQDPTVFGTIMNYDQTEEYFKSVGE